ncbi:MAG: prepilin-type N-terminal cleavage/methylation domain-containing protein [Mariprofundaceae bacterium]
MPILVVGRSDLSRYVPMREHTVASGFTLLEILLVIVILAVASAMIAPNFARQADADLEEEAVYLASLLRMGAEEAQLTGVPLRWTAMEKGFRFEQAVGAGWQPLQTAPFAPVTLHNTMQIDRLERQDGAAAPDDEKARKDKVLGYLIFYPDGMLTLAEFSLINSDDDDIERRVIRVRPGAAGIKVVKD